jgi:hypothetical protein
MGKYRQTKYEYFHGGVHEQKQPDIVFHFKRVSEEAMSKWTDNQKKEMLNLLDSYIKGSFKVWVSEIKNACKIKNNKLESLTK